MFVICLYVCNMFLICLYVCNMFLICLYVSNMFVFAIIKTIELTNIQTFIFISTDLKYKFLQINLILLPF